MGFFKNGSGYVNMLNGKMPEIEQGIQRTKRQPGPLGHSVQEPLSYDK